MLRGWEGLAGVGITLIKARGGGGEREAVQADGKCVCACVRGGRNDTSTYWY